jgi:protein-tyrosine kinase
MVTFVNTRAGTPSGFGALPRGNTHSGYAADFEETAQLNDVRDRSIGDILRLHRNLNDAQVEEILLFQRQHNLRFGEAAVALRLATNDDVLWALSQQFHYPYSPEGKTLHNSELTVAANPFGDQAEAFRELRSQLMQGVLDPTQEGPRRALAVVSPDIGDGKTFFAANLAAAFSQLGGRTLLIDADMRTPRQHSLFNVDGSRGLSNVLAGRSEHHVVHRVENMPSLFVMPVGTIPPNPLELVLRPAFSLLLHELITKFDYVLVDTPAAVHGADARVVAAKCGAALAIGRVGRTRMPAMQELVSKLGKGPGKLAGVVMNEW